MKVKISPETKKKASFIVVLLKILEVGSIFGLTFGIYYLGKFAKKYDLVIGSGGYWIHGLVFLAVMLIMLFIGGFVIYGVALFLIWIFKINWRWAIMLSETQEEKKARETFEEEKKKEKKTEFVKEYGYWVGDKVKLIKAETESDALHLNEIGTVRKIGWIYTYIEEWPTFYFSHENLKRVNPKRRKRK